MEFTNIFREAELARNILSSGILLFFLIVTRFVAVTYLSKSKTALGTQKRSLLVHINNIFTLLLVFGLVIVWAAKLQAFAISIVAIAAAVVIATKELILCFLGGFYKSIVRPFRIGDRIEVAGSRGEVIDQNFLSTELLEIGPGKSTSQFTGKSIEIPNSIFLGHLVIKEHKSARFRLHTFSVVQSLEVDIEMHRNELEQAAKQSCKDFLDDAKNFMLDLQQKEGIEAPTVDPKISISFSNKDCVEFIIRIPVPSLRGAKLEQEIILNYVRNIKAKAGV